MKFVNRFLGHRYMMVNSSLALVPRVAPGPPKCMFSLQHSLPRFPVPPLQQTLQTFLETCRPLYKEQDFEHLQKLVKKFEETDGPRLQSLLQQRAEKHINWLAEWWQRVAYLDYRYPVPIHSSPGILLPRRDFAGTKEQLRFAAHWISAVLDYKVMVDNQTLPVESLGGRPLCMQQFYQILSACRVPGPIGDSFVVHPPDQPNPPRHIVVIHNNKFFEVDVYDSNNQPLTVDQIEHQLKQVVQRSQTAGEPVGILTSAHRDFWGTVYERMKNNSANAVIFKVIQHSIFIVCLDKAMNMDNKDILSVQANQMNHGCGSSFNSANRWFDKTLQFIIGADGALGCNYEHSSAEGPPIISIIDHCMDLVSSTQNASSSHAPAPEPRPLNFDLDSLTRVDMAAASESFDKLISDLDLHALGFKSFGKDWIKTQRLSPDAFVQVCLQLAFRRLHGYNAPTYESGSLRGFQFGRTETIRSCSKASSEFCDVALSDASAKAKADSFRNAIERHKEYTSMAMQGRGVDRHLLGLKMIALEQGGQVPALFGDKVYQYSGNWKLSTSQVPSNHNALLCFGPVIPDGYGVCYNPMPQQINIAVSSWKSCKETDAQSLKSSLEKSFLDAHAWLTQASSKL